MMQRYIRMLSLMMFMNVCAYATDNEKVKLPAEKELRTRWCKASQLVASFASYTTMHTIVGDQKLDPENVAIVILADMQQFYASELGKDLRHPITKLLVRDSMDDLLRVTYADSQKTITLLEEKGHLKKATAASSQAGVQAGAGAASTAGGTQDKKAVAQLLAGKMDAAERKSS